MVWVWTYDHETVRVSAMVLRQLSNPRRLDDAPANEISRILCKVGDTTL